MRRYLIYWSILGLFLLGLASAVAAQEIAARSEGPETLFDLLQSRLKSAGLVPADGPAPAAPAANHPRLPSARPTLASPHPATAATAAPVASGTMPSRHPAIESTPAPARVNIGPYAAAESAKPTAPVARMSNRMHQRLEAFRTSTFAISHPSEAPDPSPKAAPQPPQQSTAQSAKATVPTPAPQDTAQRPTLAPRKEAAVVTEKQSPLVASPIASRIGRQVVENEVAEPEEDAVEEKAEESVEQKVEESSIAKSQPTHQAPADKPTPETEPEPAAPAAVRSPGSQVLFSRQSPIINVKTVGPEKIDVAVESTFQVFVENLGAVAADDLVVAIALPEWADLLGAEATTGSGSADIAADGSRAFLWKVGQLAAKSEESVAMNLVARSSQPFELAINWQHAPVASGAKITVLEPVLQLAIEGPEEVLFGEKQVYRLELENSGTGEARDVSLSLLPIGTGQKEPAVQAIGTLPAGGKKVVEVELIARNEGDLVIQIDATAEGGFQAELAEKVRVLRPGLAVEVAAPEFQFVGKEVVYQIVVTNPGTAATESVMLEAILPDSVAYLSSTNEGLLSKKSDRITWKVDSLAPQESRTLTVNCQATSAGESRLSVLAKSARDLQASANAEIQLEAIADLALRVTDPSGPVAVGTETEYLLTVANRGSKAAENVEVVAYFSSGIEPTKADGATHQIGPGQVVFDAIDRIGPGETKTLKVKASADATGNHIIRAEVFCKPLGTRLVAEESTYFYGRRPADSIDSEPARPAIAEEGVLTADRRDSAKADTAPETTTEDR